MKYKELIFENREDWLQWRTSGIGSSDASAIMNASRFATYESLLLSKAVDQGESTVNTYIKERGNKIEGWVRKHLEDLWKTSLVPVNCESTEFNFMRCSLDGASPNRELIIEIKLLSSVNPAKINTEAEGYVKWNNLRNKQIVPQEYVAQIQHQLMVTGAEACEFIGYRELRGERQLDPTSVAVATVDRDEQYIDRLAELEFKFWYDLIKIKSAGGQL